MYLRVRSRLRSVRRVSRGMRRWDAAAGCPGVSSAAVLACQ